MLKIPFLIALMLVAATAARASPVFPDEPGWEQLRWGMTGEELRSLLGDRLVALPGRWRYGGAYADHAAFDVVLGGLEFTAYFQMNARSGTLQQILLERRRVRATPRALESLVSAMEVRYGAASETCRQAKSGGEPLIFEMIWRGRDTTIHLNFMDFSTTDIFYRDPNRDADPLVPFRDVRRANRRFLPRRILVRFHDVARHDLVLPCDR